MPRRLKENPPEDPNATMDDVTSALHSADVPKNPDGTVVEEGEVSVLQAQNIGALDPVSDAENQKFTKVLQRKIAGADGYVPWGGDLYRIYEGIRTVLVSEWSQLSVIVSCPATNVQFPPKPAATFKSYQELYEYVEQCHGYGPSATYNVKITSRKGMVRGQAPLTLPDRAPSLQPPPQVMQQQQYGGPPVVVNMPRQEQPMAPAPEPQHSDRLTEMLLSQQQQQTAMVLGALKELAEVIRKPQMPPGFIPLPEGWPTIPQGYVAVPGGCIPAPQLPAPAPPPQVIQVPTPQASPVVQATPVPNTNSAPQGPAQQVEGAVKMMSSLFKSMEDFKTMFGGVGGTVAGAAEDVLEEEVAESAVSTVPIGDGLNMVLNKKDQTTNWPATIFAALPKLLEIGKAGVAEYSKVVDKQAAIAQQMTASRIRLAQEVQRVQGAVQPEAPQALAPPTPPPPIEVRQQASQTARSVPGTRRRDPWTTIKPLWATPSAPAPEEEAPRVEPSVSEPVASPATG
jgi:hypothetical protein